MNINKIFLTIIFSLIIISGCTKNPSTETHTMQMGHDMSSMNHNIMRVHAGTSNSAQIHKYSVELITNNIVSGLDSEIAFSIKDLESGLKVTDLEVVHDKIMHVVLVRNDLKYFDHIHPAKNENDTFSVDYSFYAPDNYRIWVDFTLDGMQHIVDFDINVPGSTINAQENNLDDIKIFMTPIDKIKTGEKVNLEFVVTDKNSNQLPIKEKFLAANAHMVIIDEALDEFGHTHDEDMNEDNKLSFEYSFIKSGLHKLWVQFSVNNTVQTREFGVNIE